MWVKCLLLVMILSHVTRPSQTTLQPVNWWNDINPRIATFGYICRIISDIKNKQNIVFIFCQSTIPRFSLLLNIAVFHRDGCVAEVVVVFSMLDFT